MAQHADGSFTCDVCDRPMREVRVEGRTFMGAWADLCLPCKVSATVGESASVVMYLSMTEDGQNWARVQH